MASDRDTLAELIAGHFPEYISGHCLCGVAAPDLASWSTHVAEVMATAGVRPPARVGEAQFAIEFDYRSDRGPRLVGPFGSREDANDYVRGLGLEEAEWGVCPLAAPELREPKAGDQR